MQLKSQELHYFLFGDMGQPPAVWNLIYIYIHTNCLTFKSIYIFLYKKNMDVYGFSHAPPKKKSLSKPLSQRDCTFTVSATSIFSQFLPRLKYNVTCHNCGILGLLARDCRKKQCGLLHVTPCSAPPSAQSLLPTPPPPLTLCTNLSYFFLPADQ